MDNAGSLCHDDVMRFAVPVLTLLAAPVLAGSNSPEAAQRRTEEEVLAKLTALCGVPLTLRYDAASLKANNKDIGWDQTGGSLECDEPLRYLWALCRTPQGPAAVKRAEVRGVVCVGVHGSEGALRLDKGLFTVERAYEEKAPHRRARRQFEVALDVKLSLSSDDPYSDTAWREFRQAPNPVTSTTDYCLVNGQKRELDSMDQFLRQDGTVKCLEHGVVLADVVVKSRRKTGLTTATRDDWRRVERWVDDRLEGLSEDFEGKALLSQTAYRANQRVWDKDFYPSGALKSYTLHQPKLLHVDFHENGRVSALSCAPEAKGDPVLEPWCGFRGDKTVEVTDSDGVITSTVTYRDGKLKKQVAGPSRYSNGRTVAYVDGEKDGEERVVRRDGTLESLTTWRRGTQHGRAQRFSDDGKKVVEALEWKDGVVTRRTTYYLNGKERLVETWEGEAALRRVEHYDLGQPRVEGRFVRCPRRDLGQWCPDGQHVEYFENGKVERETTWRAGQRVGPSRTFFPSGALKYAEDYVDDRLAHRKELDESGKVLSDYEYEADGSRK